MFGHIGVLDLSLSPRHLIRLKYPTIMKLDFMHVLRSVSFWLAAFCLTKSLLCNVAILSEMPYISESLKVFQKSFSSVQRKILCRFHSEKSDPKFPSRQPSHAFGRPSMSRSFEQFKIVSVRTSWPHVQTLFKVRKILALLCRNGVGRQLAPIRMLGQHCPDARATPSGHQDP